MFEMTGIYAPMSGRAMMRRILAMLSLSVLCVGVDGCDFPASPLPVGLQDFETTRVRYVNMTNMPADSTNKHILQARFTLYSASTRTTSSTVVTTQTVTSLGVSDFFTPLADTGRVSVSVTSGMNVNRPSFPELIQTFKSRNATYTIVGLPPRAGSMQVLDTLLVITSLPPDNSANAANIRFINCVNDATKTYSFTLGCPSGTPVGSRLGYRASSGSMPIALNGDNMSVALTEQLRPISSTASAPAPVQKGLFNIRPLAPNNSYTILLYKDAKDTLRLLALNDRTSDKISVVTAKEPSTFVRVVNFSSEAIDSVGYGTKGIAPRLGSNSISGYAPLSACASAGSDTLLIQRRSGIRQQVLSTSLEVNGSQTVFLSDSLAVAAPALAVQPPDGSISLRVVNLTYVPSLQTSSSVSVLRGAVNQLRPQTIVGNLASGQISAPVTVSRESYLPLLIFNNQQPQSLEQFGVIGTMNMTASAYFVVVTKSRIFLIPDVTAASAPPQANLPPLPQGTLIQAAQVFADATTGTAQMRLGAVFSDAVGYGATQTTVLPNDKHNIILGSIMRDVTTTEGGRLTIIGMGTVGAGRIIVEQGSWAAPDRPSLPGNALQQGTFRYVNASSDVDSLLIQNDGTSDFRLLMPLGRGNSTPVTRFYRSQSLTFNFKRDTSTTLFVARNLLFSVSRAYTVIFAGQQDKAYSVVVMPEY